MTVLCRQHVLRLVLLVVWTDLRVVRGAEVVIVHVLLAGTEVARLAGELHVQTAVAGSVGLLELPDVVVGSQVVVGVVVGVVVVLLPGVVPGKGGGAVALVCDTPAH